LTTSKNQTELNKIKSVDEVSTTQLPNNKPTFEDSPLPPIITSDSSSNMINMQKPVERLVSQHLNSLTSVYAESQAREYRQSKTSPLINTDSSINTFLPAEIAPQIDVDCVSTTKKILASISTFTQGRLKCRQHNFEQFIDKRLGNSLNDEDKSEHSN